MNRDERLTNLPLALANVSDELVQAGVAPLAVAVEMGAGLRLFMARHLTADQQTGLLGEQINRVEHPTRKALPPELAELLELGNKAQQFINTLQIAGIDEGTAVTALHNACVMRVARTRGAAGAVAWLRSLADLTEAQAREVDHIAKNA